MKYQLKAMFVIAYILLSFNGFSQEVDAGNGHAIMLDTLGQVWTIGRNNHGQIGNGNYGNTAVPYKVKTLPQIQHVARGYDHCLALDFDGQIWAWGLNNYGQLATPEKVNYSTPQMLKMKVKFTAIEGGHYHTIALADDSTVYSWGHNYFGELGLKNREHSMYPKRVHVANGTDTTYLKGIVQIASVGYHTMALNKQGEVFTWGSNTHKELGWCNKSKSTVAGKVDVPGMAKIAAGWQFSVAIDSSGNLWSWGKDQAKKYDIKNMIIRMPKLFENTAKMRDIACGSWHALAIDSSDNVYAWGRNKFGMLGQNDTVSRSIPTLISTLKNVEKIGGGCFQSLMIDEKGDVFTCGDNPSGQQGNTSHHRVYKPMKMGLNLFSGLTVKSETANSIVANTSSKSPAFLSKLKFIHLLLGLSLLINGLLLFRVFR